MKVNFLVFLCLLLGISTFSACSDEQTEPVDNTGGEISGITDQDLSDIQVLDSGSTSWHDHYSTMLKEAQQGNGEEDSLMVAFAMRQLAKADSINDAYLDSIGANGGDHGLDGSEGSSWMNGYKYVNIRYNSVDLNGNPIQLSELLIYPKITWFAVHPDNILVSCHDFITADKERPSDGGSSVTCWEYAESNTVLGWFDDYAENLVIVPDYQGYGASKYDMHPLMEFTLTARQVVDGTIAAKKWFERYVTSLEDDYKTVFMGYGEGGSVALSAHRYVEQNNLSGVLNFVGSVTGCGIYKPYETFVAKIQNDRFYDLKQLAMMINSLCATDFDMKKEGCTPSDFFSSSFLKTGILEMLSLKMFSKDEIQQKLLDYSWDHPTEFTMMRKDTDYDKDEYWAYNPSNKNTEKGKKREWRSVEVPAYCNADQVLTSGVIQYFTKGSCADAQQEQKMQALEKALKKRDLIKGWFPQHPLTDIYNEYDEIVPSLNYESVGSAFYSNFYGKKICECPSSYHSRAEREIFHGLSWGTLYFTYYTRGINWSKKAHFSSTKEENPWIWINDR